MKEIAPSIVLENTSPVNAELDGYRAAQCHAHALIKNLLPLSVKEIAKPSISEIELSSLFRHADLIPGMCDHEKLCVLCEIARYSPCGDVVEIGSWWGKSAFILARLAHCYNIGNLLCVDPWSNEHLVQHDEKIRLSSSVDCGFDAGWSPRPSEYDFADDALQLHWRRRRSSRCRIT